MFYCDILNCTGLYNPIMGARNSWNSWDKSDSCENSEQYNEELIGPADMDLAKRLTKAGPEHRKFLRMIHVIMNVNADSSFWAEADTYKYIVRNSTSTMHTLARKNINFDNFNFNGLDFIKDRKKANIYEDNILHHLCFLEELRTEYNKTKDYGVWKLLVQNLPRGYEMLSTLDMNYETVLNIIKQRHNHKLVEWQWFCQRMMELPYIPQLYGAMMGIDKIKIGERTYNLKSETENENKA